MKQKQIKTASEEFLYNLKWAVNYAKKITNALESQVPNTLFVNKYNKYINNCLAIRFGNNIPKLNYIGNFVIDDNLIIYKNKISKLKLIPELKQRLLDVSSSTNVNNIATNLNPENKVAIQKVKSEDLLDEIIKAENKKNDVIKNKINFLKKYFSTNTFFYNIYTNTFLINVSSTEENKSLASSVSKLIKTTIQLVDSYPSVKSSQISEHGYVVYKV